MQRLPTGESSFEKIREGNQLYVDKTRHLHDLLQAGDYYFLSRPRRFGKSLTVSTLKALFEGRRELFEGLWIHDRWDWTKANPTLVLSLNGLDYHNQPLEEALRKKFDWMSHDIGLPVNDSATSKEKFGAFILHLGRTARVAVLIDEYDKPINDYLDETDKANQNRETLANLFGVLKDQDVVDHLRFVFITGVSKFSKVTLFSELNNLTDLTHHRMAATLLGITQAELERYFGLHIAVMADEMALTQEELLAKIKRWYNGYSWDGVNHLYNPYSLLNLFSGGSFENYWFASGTTAWLARRMREVHTDARELEGMVVGKGFFDKFEVGRLDPAVLLYQTGYLTIKEVMQGDMPAYRLGYPNQEVRDAFLNNLLREYADTPVSEVDGLLRRIRAALEANDPDTFIMLLKGIFAGISNRLLTQYVKAEGPELWEPYYQTVIYLALSLAGAEVDCEVQTNKGYIDAVAETSGRVYVMEFKRGAAAEALRQMHERGYHENYLHLGNPITLLGVGFDPVARNIGGWEAVEVGDV